MFSSQFLRNVPENLFYRTPAKGCSAEQLQTILQSATSEISNILSIFNYWANIQLVALLMYEKKLITRLFLTLIE